MNVEIWTEAAQFLFWEYINSNFLQCVTYYIVDHHTEKRKHWYGHLRTQINEVLMMSQIYIGDCVTRLFFSRIWFGSWAARTGTVSWSCWTGSPCSLWSWPPPSSSTASSPPPSSAATSPGRTRTCWVGRLFYHSYCIVLDFASPYMNFGKKGYTVAKKFGKFISCWKVPLIELNNPGHIHWYLKSVYLCEILLVICRTVHRRNFPPKHTEFWETLELQVKIIT